MTQAIRHKPTGILLLLLALLGSMAEGQELVPSPTVRDLTPDSSRTIALTNPGAKGTAVLAIVKDIRPMPEITEVDAVFVPNVTYAQAYRFGERVDGFYWIAESILSYERLLSAPKTFESGCSAGGCGRINCDCFCWARGGSCFCTQCF